MATSPPLFLLSFFLFFNFPPLSDSRPHTTSTLLKPQLFSLSSQSPNSTAPTLYFEVTKPINLPKTKPCSQHILHHDFNFTYGKPPVTVSYTPPSHFPSKKFSKIVLQWHATSKGRQFDRIFGIWLGGVEIFRSCTAEPRVNGIVWTVEKDITRYYSLLMKKKSQPFSVYLGNLVDSTYTGAYHVNITMSFYPDEAHEGFDGKESGNFNDMGPGYGSQADLILPISRNPPLNDGFWFELENSTDIQTKEFKIPRNAYKAVLEVYVSPQQNDEFWYANYPNDYIEANNLSGVPGNGPFREVLVHLDGELVGAIWPFTVIYTGGVNPLFWRPITGIGSFDVPTYDIEITPFLGKILDGGKHEFAFSVMNALNVWFIDANLHIWLDKKSKETSGRLVANDDTPLRFDTKSNFTGLNGTFFTTGSRYLSSTGWVKSSYGKILTRFVQGFNYTNTMVIQNDGNMQMVNQTIDFNDGVHIKLPSSRTYVTKSLKRFPLYLYTDYFDQGNGTYILLTNVSLGFHEEKFKISEAKSSRQSLRNSQNGEGYMLVKDNLVVGGLGSTQEVYRYRGPEFCYFRNVSTFNYTILYDKVEGKCSKRELFQDTEDRGISPPVSLSSISFTS